MDWVPVTNFNQLRPGDHLRITRARGPLKYDHHGIYVSPEEVIAGNGLDEFSIRNVMFRGGGIVVTDLAGFVNINGTVPGSLYKRLYSRAELRYKNKPEQIIAIARAMVGVRNYDLMSANCEAFANICTFGKAESGQVNHYLGMIAGGSTSLAAMIGLTKGIEENYIRIPLIVSGMLLGTKAGGKIADAYTSRQFYENDKSALTANKFWEQRGFMDRMVSRYDDLEDGNE